MLQICVYFLNTNSDEERHVMSTMSLLEVKLRRANKIYHEGVSNMSKLSCACDDVCIYNSCALINIIEIKYICLICSMTTPATPTRHRVVALLSFSLTFSLVCYSYGAPYQ